MIKRLQRAFGESVRSRVAGEDAAERATQIWGKPGPRWFTRTDPIWRVHEDASMFPGGIAALLLQTLHPLAMAGVAGHSGYRADPWGRLKRTSDYIAITTYATIPDAEALIAAAEDLALPRDGVSRRPSSCSPIHRGRAEPRNWSAVRANGGFVPVATESSTRSKSMYWSSWWWPSATDGTSTIVAETNSRCGELRTTAGGSRR